MIFDKYCLYSAYSYNLVFQMRSYFANNALYSKNNMKCRSVCLHEYQTFADKSQKYIKYKLSCVSAIKKCCVTIDSS